MRHTLPQSLLRTVCLLSARSAVVLLIVSVNACSDPPLAGPSPSIVTDQMLSPQSDAWRQYLPYGVPIPEDARLTQVPEPYDPVKHGPAYPNTQPNENLVGKPGFVLPPPPGRWAKYPSPIVVGSQSYALSITPTPSDGGPV